jgi:outer membrane protein assembly factor BamB
MVFIGLMLIGIAGVTVAQTTRKADESRIQKLVADLGDREFKVREGATRELTAIGADARPALAKAATSSDLEVAQRAKAILSQIAKACFDAASKDIQDKLLWSYPVKDGMAGRISIKDGVAYVAGLDHALHAVDIKTGKEKWSQAQLSQDATAAPSGALVSDKAALAILDNGDVTGLDVASGKVNWQYKREQPANPQPVVNPAPMPGGVVRAMRPGLFGRQKPIPAVVGSTLYLPQEDNVVLVDTETGKKQKDIKLASSSAGTPVVGGDRMIVHLADGTVRGYSLSDGSETWKHAGGATAGCVTCWEGKAYFVGDPMTMYALDFATGKELWQCSMVEDAGATDPNVRVMHPGAIIAPGQLMFMGQPLTSKDGTVYTLQGLNLIGVDAKDGKKKLQCQIDVWRNETSDATTARFHNNLMVAIPRVQLGSAQTAAPFVMDGNIAYVNGGQLGIYAVGLDDGVARWAFRTNNTPVGDMVLLDGVIYFGTARQGVGMRPVPMPPAAVGVNPAKPADEGSESFPAGLHALKIK